METIITPQDNRGMVVSEHSRHNDHGNVERLELANLNAEERFSLRILDEVSCLRREISESKGKIELKIVEENNKTRDLMREHEIAKMRADEATLRAQLIAAGIVPSA